MGDRPNILISYTDQQRWDALGAFGNSEIHTPNLDRLAAESVYSDPMEYRDVSVDTGTEILADHRARLLHRLMEIERPSPRIWPY
jgi:hypothetical protein